MFESLKKIAFKKSLVGSIFMIIIGIMLIIFMGQQALAAITGYTKFEELDYDEIKNQLVEVDFDINMGVVIEQQSYKKNTRTGATTPPKTTHYFYLTLTGDSSAWFNTGYPSEDNYYILVRVPVSFKGDMDDVMESTYESMYADRDHITLYGKIKKLSSEHLSYFEKAIENAFGSSELAYIVPYYVDVYANKTLQDVMGLLLTGVGLVLIIIAIVRICGAASGSTLKKLRNDLAAAGLTDASAESDYNSAVTFSKGAELRIGRQCIYYMSGSIPRAIPTTQLTWTYQTTTTHRRNGIKTGTTYSILFYINGEKNAVTYPVPNEATVQEALRQINDRFPWVVVGYTEDLRRMYNKDRNQFMNLRFNTVDHTPVEPGFGAASYTAASTADTSSASQQTGVSVELTDAGAEKIKVIQVIREVTGLGLKEAKDIADGVTRTVKQGISQAEAEDIKRKLEDAGAKATIR